MNSREAVDALAALGHEHRLGVYRRLTEAGPEGLSAGAIAAHLGMPPSSLTFHLRNLQNARLVTRKRKSRQLIYAADTAVMNSLVEFLADSCRSSQPAMCLPTFAAALAPVRAVRSRAR